VAAVGSLMTSSHRRIALFGVANAVVVPLLVLLSARAFTSLWCLWAAVASVVVADHVRRGASAGEKQLARPHPQPAAVVSEWFHRTRFGAH